MSSCNDCFHYKACKRMFENFACEWEDFDGYERPDADKCENFIDESYVEINERRMFIAAYREVLDEAWQRSKEKIRKQQAEAQKNALEKADEQPWNRKLEVDLLKFESDRVDISKELKLFNEAQLKREFAESIKEEK